jgi:hypothetical protein
MNDIATMSTTYYNGTVVFRNGGYTDTTSTYRKTTVNLIPTTLVTVVMDAGNRETYVFDVRVVGYVTGGEDAFISYTLMANNDHGSITLYGGNGGSGGSEYPMLLMRDGTSLLEGSRVTSSLSGNTVTISLIGVAGQTVTWVGTVRTHKAIH